MNNNTSKRGRPAVHGIQALEVGQLYVIENGSIRNVQQLARYHRDRLNRDYIVKAAINHPTLIGVIRIK